MMFRPERPCRRARGAAMVEYVLMVGLIAVVAMAAAKELGPIVVAKLQSASSAFGGASGQGAAPGAMTNAP